MLFYLGYICCVAVAVSVCHPNCVSAIQATCCSHIIQTQFSLADINKYVANMTKVLWGASRGFIICLWRQVSRIAVCLLLLYICNWQKEVNYYKLMYAVLLRNIISSLAHKKKNTQNTQILGETIHFELLHLHLPS